MRVVTITGKGRARLRKAVPHWRRAQKRLETALGVARTQALNDMLEAAVVRLQDEAG